MHLAVSERSGEAEGLGGGPKHTAEIGVAVSYCAAVGSGSWDDVDHSRGRQEQAHGVAVAGALPCGRGSVGCSGDATRPGRKPPLTAEVIAEVVEKTLREKPAAATHWSTRRMARAVGLGHTSVKRIWHGHGLKPHRTRASSCRTISSC
jgi:hypothetical protein